MIKLTPTVGTPLYLNPSHIVQFFRMETKGFTMLYTTLPSQNVENVQETPDEIMRKIEVSWAVQRGE